MNRQLQEFIAQAGHLNAQELAWLSGWCWAKSEQVQPASSTSLENITTTVMPRITVLSASQTGNARSVAEQLFERLQAQSLDVELVAVGDYKPKNLVNESILVLVTSTQGEGEPPEEARSFYQFLYGKKAPKLDNLQFAVLGLGDSSYPKFCGAAIDFDEKLAQLGGKRLLERQDCDLDFADAAQQWVEKVVAVLGEATHASPVVNYATGLSTTKSPTTVFNKNNPFAASLLTCQKITGRYSDKDVRHIELDLAGSDLTYQAGDALGVWFNNDVALVDAMLQQLNLNADCEVVLKSGTKPLRQAMIEDLELTQNTSNFVKNYAQFVSVPEDLLALKEGDIQQIASSYPIAHLVAHYPAKLTEQQWVGLLRPLTPRLYSIASAQEEVGEEVHLTVGLVRYECEGKPYSGGASSYLAERVEEGESVRIFVEPNVHFRLPENPEVPIIMIGAGTGMAPFRSFLQQRCATEATGKNWLIYGNRQFSEDFLYQTEWQSWLKEGFLHRYHFAWSRDGEKKVYVQDKIRENAEEIWQWLQDGAMIYVCGDAAKMAKDVERALLDVIVLCGHYDEDAAAEYLDELRQAKRYRRDVY